MPLNCAKLVLLQAEIGFLAFQVELLELTMTGPTGQIGKNNMRELASLSIWLGEPDGRLLLPAGLGMASGVLGWGSRTACSVLCPGHPTWACCPCSPPS
uniref:Uncharacterized protein n=1 Tax=Serinus canaria TaxID=9135 RepID=A0A8C9UFN1_SERCA